MTDTADSTGRGGTVTKRAPTKKAAAKKRAAKRAAAPRTATRKATATPVAAAEPVATGQRPDYVFVMSSLDAAADLAGEVDAAGRELVSRLQAMGTTSFTVPSPVLESLADAAQSTDVAAILRAQQAYSDAVQAVVQDAATEYSEAVSVYAKQLEKSWTAARERNSKLFANYVTAVSGQLRHEPGNPAVAAEVGWSLVNLAPLGVAGQIGG